MRDKLKEKSLDLICTFIGSILAISLYSLVLPIENKILVSLNWNKQIIVAIENFTLSSFVAIGFIVSFLLLTKISVFFVTPKIIISFYNTENVETSEIDFRDDNQEPKFVKVKFEVKLNKFQKKIIEKYPPKILISSNPRMCEFELDRGFIFDNQDYCSNEKGFVCDIVKNFQNSDKTTSISVDINILLVNKARGELKAVIFLDTIGGFIKYLLGFYYHCTVSKLEIIGE